MSLSDVTLFPFLLPFYPVCAIICIIMGSYFSFDFNLSPGLDMKRILTRTVIVDGPVVAFMFLTMWIEPNKEIGMIYTASYLVLLYGGACFPSIYRRLNTCVKARFSSA